MVNKVVYLTGAPAAGKSSMTRRLRELVPSLSIFEYGAELTKYVNELRGSKAIDQARLREQSSQIVTPADVAAVDELLIKYVRENRSTRHVIIDSHAVTKEKRPASFTAIACIDFAASGNTRRWADGMPTPQQRANRPIKSTNGRLRKTEARSSKGVRPTILGPSSEATISERASDIPNDVRMACCSAVSPVSRLNLAVSFHTNSTRSPNKDRGESPKLRARVNLSSAWADRELAASSLHHFGQAALMAWSLRPARLSSLRRFFVSSFTSTVLYQTL